MSMSFKALSWWSMVLLLRIGNAIVVDGESRLWQLQAENCSEVPCYNAENLCGRFAEPCVLAGNDPTASSGIWSSALVELSYADRHFRRVERGALDLKACREGQFVVETTYEGKWDLHGGSPFVKGLSLASVEISKMAVALLQLEVCKLETNGRRYCSPTVPALSRACPCNGRDWSNSVQRERDDVASACLPREQCPLLNDVYFRDRHYFSYRASAVQVCLSEPYESQRYAWMNPRDQGCSAKSEPYTCLGGALLSTFSGASGQRRFGGSLLSLSHSAAWLLSVAVILAVHASGVPAVTAAVEDTRASVHASRDLVASPI
eukprot:CAMPEP_0204134266 /NCGR_PEP_ID=MMETSP0361-20130328/15571_1 /ASSEMBLY_ACC=CAM_ASM_000343 /TAXON_ID=268821 /ORGANISM="Scrippsiella Hangoei, Strain SHTV-5" /LENGTH=319 /DNA_ID=CAMNT_0051087439 /DNA_START=20 /DNA_END=976 /DNA_ORIENTATION=+